MLLAVAAAAAGCTRTPDPTPPTRIVHDDRRAAAMASIPLDVGPAKWTRSADGRETFVEGAVRNRGTTPTREIRVRVLGVDSAGNVVTRGDGQPTPQLVLPGASARYLVRLPNDPTITTFHVEAIGR